MKNLIKNNFYKFTKFNYIFTTPNTKLSDLKYKEEIFEYFSYNHNRMNENEINEIFLKLLKFKILSNEMIYFKIFYRDFLSIQKQWKNEEMISNSILLFIDKYKDVREYITDNTNLDNQYDKNFYQLINSFITYTINNCYKLRKENIIVLFKLNTLFTDDSLELFKNSMIIYNNTEQIDPFSIEFSTEVLLYIVQMMREKLLKPDDEIKIFLKKYELKLNNECKKNTDIFKELYYNLIIFDIAFKSFL